MLTLQYNHIYVDKLYKTIDADQGDLTTTKPHKYDLSQSARSDTIKKRINTTESSTNKL